MGRFRRHEGRLPADLIRQLHAAEQLCDELADSGVELRFETADATGATDAPRVRAVLVDDEGAYIRDVRLSDVVSLRIDD